jgi:hypothetical protein
MNESIYDVLIIDDDLSYVNGQYDTAYNNNINLVHFDNWEDARLELESNLKKFNAIIIDGRGKLSPNSKTEDKKHLITVLDWFEDQKNKNHYYNFVINSAFLEDYTEFIDFNKKNIKIYYKGKDEELMYKELVKLIISFPLYKIRCKYEEVLDIFDDIVLPSSHNATMVNLLMMLDGESLINEPFNSMRHILEAMCKSINKIDYNFFSSILIDEHKDTPNLTAATFVLCGKDFKNPYVNIKAPPKVMFPTITCLN